MVLVEDENEWEFQWTDLRRQGLLGKDLEAELHSGGSACGL